MNITIQVYCLYLLSCYVLLNVSLSIMMFLHFRTFYNDALCYYFAIPTQLPICAIAEEEKKFINNTENVTFYKNPHPFSGEKQQKF